MVKKCFPQFQYHPFLMWYYLYSGIFSPDYPTLERRQNETPNLSQHFLEMIVSIFLLLFLEPLFGYDPSQHKFPYCYPGQAKGPGWVSFDHCQGNFDSSFVCADSKTCELDHCGGFQHSACSCSNCTRIENPGKDSLICGCDPSPNFGCWCDYPNSMKLARHSNHYDWFRT